MKIRLNLRRALLKHLRRAAAKLAGSRAVNPTSDEAADAFAASAIIPLQYQFNLLCDSSRLFAFSEAIKLIVRPHHTVLDLGCGTGVLALLAARTAQRVIAVEKDPLVHKYARKFLEQHDECRRISILCEDALKLRSLPKADVIICEMLDTGLLHELQVPVMNKAIKRFLKPGGTVIPLGVTSTVSLGIVDYSTVLGISAPLPHFLGTDTSRLLLRVSDAVPYSTLNFTQQNSDILQKTIDLQVRESGEINALIIETMVTLTEALIVSGSEWLNPPLVLPLPLTPVERGQRISISLTYRLGGGLGSLEYAIV